MWFECIVNVESIKTWGEEGERQRKWEYVRAGLTFVMFDYSLMKVWYSYLYVQITSDLNLFTLDLWDNISERYIVPVQCCPV